MSTRRAGCGESRTSGSEGGPRRRAGSNAGTAPRSDPYTDLPTWQGFLYLAVVLDVFSRRVVGWAMAGHLRTELVLDALEMALWTRRKAGVTSLTGLVHHTDSEYEKAGCPQAS
jgi:transposase InsO family protein